MCITQWSRLKSSALFFYKCNKLLFQFNFAIDFHSPSWNINAPSMNSTSFTSCGAPARLKITVIWDPEEMKVSGKRKIPASLRAFRTLGEHILWSDLFCPVSVRSTISMTDLHEGDLKWIVNWHWFSTKMWRLCFTLVYNWTVKYERHHSVFPWIWVDNLKHKLGHAYQNDLICHCFPL